MERSSRGLNAKHSSPKLPGTFSILFHPFPTFQPRTAPEGNRTSPKCRVGHLNRFTPQRPERSPRKKSKHMKWIEIWNGWNMCRNAQRHNSFLRSLWYHASSLESHQSHALSEIKLDTFCGSKEALGINFVKTEIIWQNSVSKVSPKFVLVL